MSFGYEAMVGISLGGFLRIAIWSLCGVLLVGGDVTAMTGKRLSASSVGGSVELNLRFESTDKKLVATLFNGSTESLALRDSTTDVGRSFGAKPIFRKANLGILIEPEDRSPTLNILHHVRKHILEPGKSFDIVWDLAPDPVRRNVYLNHLVYSQEQLRGALVSVELVLATSLGVLTSNTVQLP